MINNNDVFNRLTVKSETIKLETFNNVEIVIKEPTINESKQIESIRSLVLKGELDFLDLAKEVSKICAGATDEQLDSLGKDGVAVINEIFMKVQEIGMTDEQKEIHRNKIAENINNEIKKLTSEEIEKKPLKKKDLSSN